MATAPHLLVVEDDPDIRELIVHHLITESYRISEAANGEEAWKKIAALPPDLVVLDLMLPGISGLEVCRLMKRNVKTENCAILMLTALGSEEDIVRGLNLGADDYITKPFSPKVLLARIAALLRRRKTTPDQQVGDELVLGDMILSTRRREVFIGGDPARLTYTEFQILEFLARREGWVYTRGQIIDCIRGDDYPVTERSVDFQIVGLRKKLGSMGSWLKTVRGVGYTFKKPE
ncbi:MAG: response regulator transcription factor [FCB group bacterium]|nr:response regulator transcription factor [FCB group bacterium]